MFEGIRRQWEYARRQLAEMEESEQSPSRWTDGSLIVLPPPLINVHHRCPYCNSQIVTYENCPRCGGPQ